MNPLDPKHSTNSSLPSADRQGYLAYDAECMDGLTSFEVIPSTTIAYYEENADEFVASTANVEFSAMQEKFISLLAPGASVLDFGCGSGRDAKSFIEKGLKVTATDGSPSLCRIASRLTGIEVRNELFQELSDVAEYDGIWACSSILHLPKRELAGVFPRMVRALKPNGIIYTSFKYGSFEGYRNGRYFTDFTEEGFHDFIAAVVNVDVVESWVSSDVRPGRGGERWLNLLLVKS